MTTPRALTSTTALLSSVVLLTLASAISTPGPAFSATAAAAATAADAPTFSSHVASVLHENCVELPSAQPDRADVAPAPTTRCGPGRSRSRKNVRTAACRPGTPTRGIGHFANDAQARPAEIDTLVRWVQAGAPAGDPARAPAPAGVPGRRVACSASPTSWSRSTRSQLPAGRTDQFPKLIGTRRCCPRTGGSGGRDPSRQPQGRPPRHRGPGEGLRRARPAGRLARRLGRGHRSDGVPAGHRPPARRRAPTSSPTCTTTRPTPTQRDITRIGIHFADGPVDKELVNLWVSERRLRDPGRRQDHEVVSSYKHLAERQDHGPHPAHALPRQGLQVHRLLPRRPPGGAAQVRALGLQLADRLRAGPADPGARRHRIEVVAHYDNSADNPVNPDPTRNGPLRATSPTTR